MNRRFLMSLIAIALLAPIVLAGQAQVPAARTAKPFAPSKTPWGDPDLQGTWTSDDSIGVPMQRPAAAGTRLTATDEEIAQRQANIARQEDGREQEFAAPDARVGTGPPSHWGEGARRPSKQTSLIIDPPDGRQPALTPEAQQRQAAVQKRRQGVPGSWEDRSFYDRCLSRGLAGSILPVIYGNGQQIVQAPGHVVILSEMIHEARIIPLDGRPRVGQNIRTYMGDSRGRWEGSTLVVETGNFLDGKTGIGLNGGGVPTSDALRIVERFTRTGANQIDYEMTIEDPKTFTKPWKVAFPLTKETGYANFEYACHEGNYALNNILSAARAEEKAAAEKK